MRVKGSAGPSGLDSGYWRRLCSCFSASTDLCDAIALFTCRLCTSFLDPSSLSAFVTCRLITLEKCPGVRPIGVGETIRHIVCTSIMTITRNDILDSVGSLQLCAGQDSGCEAAFHSINHTYSSDDSEAVLFIDENAFNALNRSAALHNVLNLVHYLGVHLLRNPVNLYIDGETILSMKVPLKVTHWPWHEFNRHQAFD